MVISQGFKKISGFRPLYVVAGAGQYAVEKLRTWSRQLQGRAQEVPKTSAELPGRAREVAVEDLPVKALTYIGTAADKVGEIYDDLTVRGRTVISKVSRDVADQLRDVSEKATPAVAPERKAEAKRRPPAKKPARRRKTEARS
ncbi:hypothetical protein [Microtetraspora fusca]|uniref:Uncharacterized protein n=1 Tax=Microtetraspora fusca TaxID=1997 RepID=A0ABW6VFB6_MICFU|nr:hypothetical protein [Microtetraspora fusca]